VDPPVGGGLSYSFQRLVGTNRRRKALRRKTMKKKVALFLALFVGSAAIGGCTILPPTMESPKAVWRSWVKDIGEMQKFTDKHFLNYDYDDPFNE
jgi:hypothetical protein